MSGDNCKGCDYPLEMEQSIQATEASLKLDIHSIPVLWAAHQCYRDNSAVRRLLDLISRASIQHAQCGCIVQLCSLLGHIAKYFTLTLTPSTLQKLLGLAERFSHLSHCLEHAPMLSSETKVTSSPPPPCLGTTLRKNRPLVPRSNSRTPFFTRVLGFSWFWWM